MATTRKPKKGKGPKLRVISVNVNGRQKAKELSKFAPEDQAYFTDLHSILDKIYAESASAYDWTWNQLASQAGLAYQTVAKLGDRETKWPRFLTVYRLAKAVGWELVIHQTVAKKASKILKVG